MWSPWHRKARISHLRATALRPALERLEHRLLLTTNIKDTEPNNDPSLSQPDDFLYAQPLYGDTSYNITGTTTTSADPYDYYVSWVDKGDNITLSMQSSANCDFDIFGLNSDDSVVPQQDYYNISSVSYNHTVGNGGWFYVDISAPDGTVPPGTPLNYSIQITGLSSYVAVIQTAYSGKHGPDNYPISSDPTPTQAATPYSSPQWVNAAVYGNTDTSLNRNYPVLYVDNTTLTAAAYWELPIPLSSGIPFPPGGIFPGPIYARGIGPDGIDIPATQVTQDDSILSLPPTAAMSAFGSGVQYYQHFQIDWQLSFDSGQDWVDTGSTDNSFYITAKDPIPDPQTGALYLTVVEQAVLHTIGDSSEGDIVAGTWSDFTTLNVQRADGTPLTYYANKNSLNVDVNSLLANGDGECYAWAQLFLDMLLINGVVQSNDYLNITSHNPSTLQTQGFLVQNWLIPDGTGHGIRYNHNYTFANVINGTYGQNLIKNNQYNFVYQDVIHNQPGLAGQGGTDPASIFGNHQVDYIDGTYYDPSYGVTYSSIQDFSAKAVAGFFVLWQGGVQETKLGVDLNGDGKLSNTILPYDMLLIRKNNNPSDEDFSVTSITWGGNAPAVSFKAPSSVTNNNAISMRPVRSITSDAINISTLVNNRHASIQVANPSPFSFGGTHDATTTTVARRLVNAGIKRRRIGVVLDESEQ
jgi:hypothetical protein